ncbi:MAG TPA: NAD-dependent epimerase [Streptosporangiaceae bacterium]|nr:NAD-dependent epimerase [Streptosporangiaceae bacterium]
MLGGAWLLGRLVAEDSLSRGFDVTVFNEGRGADSLPRGVRYIRGDRRLDADLHALAKSGPWDVVVDISGKAPAVVRRSVRALAQVAGRYVSVSAVSVYREWPDVPVDEDSPLWAGDADFDPGAPPWEPDVYGRMKAGCEMVCRDAFGDDGLLILRLHTIIGQYDDDGPLLWWLNRMRRGGPVLVPAPDRAIQPVDVRDLCRFLVDQVQRGTTGAFNVAAPADGRTYGAMVQACAEVVAADAAAEPELVWADEDWLADQGVRPWTELPLWHNAAAAWEVSADRAVAVGLRCRPLVDTASGTWRWLNSGVRKVDRERITRYGIDPAREAEIIARWQAAMRRYGARP